jgi:hypothetical protein
MHPYWDSLIEPALVLRRPSSIVEVGSEQGKTTRRLLAFCKRYGGTVHAIDPAPQFDVSSWQQQFGDRFAFQQALSLQAIPTLGRFDVIFLDGDHNWYTVYHELVLIERRSRELGQRFPLVLFHDLGWPYGRRDLYYAPDTIPAEYRQPYAKKGLRPGAPELQDQGGLNSWLQNASTENTPRNGVLTGIEDYLKQTQQVLELIVLPGFHGLGLLFPTALVDTHPTLVQFLKSLRLPAPLRRYFDQLETARLETVLRVTELQAAGRQLEARAKDQLQRLQARIQALTNALQAKEAELEVLHRRLAHTPEPAAIEN